MKKRLVAPAILIAASSLVATSPVSAAPASGCRASAMRIEGSPVVEPIVANAAFTSCVKEAAALPAGANPVYFASPILGDPLPSPAREVADSIRLRVSISGAFARTNPTGGGIDQFADRVAEAGASKVVLFFPTDVTYAYTWIDALVARASAYCVGTVPLLDGESHVGRVRNIVGAEVPVGGAPLDQAIPGGVIRFNRQVLSDSNGDGVNDTIRQQAAFVDMTNPAQPDMVFGEARASITC